MDDAAEYIKNHLADLQMEGVEVEGVVVDDSSYVAVRRGGTCLSPTVWGVPVELLCQLGDLRLPQLALATQRVHAADWALSRMHDGRHVENIKRAMVRELAESLITKLTQHLAYKSEVTPNSHDVMLSVALVVEEVTVGGRKGVLVTCK